MDQNQIRTMVAWSALQQVRAQAKAYAESGNKDAVEAIQQVVKGAEAELLERVNELFQVKWIQSSQ